MRMFKVGVANFAYAPVYMRCPACNAWVKLALIHAGTANKSMFRGCTCLSCWQVIHLFDPNIHTEDSKRIRYHIEKE